MLVNAEIVAQGLNGIEQEKALKKKLILLCKSKLEPFKVPAVFKFAKKTKLKN